MSRWGDVDPRMRVHHLEVSRTARWVELGSVVQEPDEVWFVLHGFRQLAHRFLGRFHGLDDGTRRIVAPEALNRFYLGDTPGRHGPDAPVGATWMTRWDREHEIRDYVAYLDRLAREVLGSVGGAPRVGVLGYSQGVHTAARWVSYGDAARPYRTVLWSACLPPDLDGARAAPRLAATDLWWVVGSGDPQRRDDLERAHRTTLEGWGVPVRERIFDGGHELDEEVLAEVVGAPRR